MHGEFLFPLSGSSVRLDVYTLGEGVGLELQPVGGPSVLKLLVTSLP